MSSKFISLKNIFPSESNAERCLSILNYKHLHWKTAHYPFSYKKFPLQSPPLAYLKKFSQKHNPLSFISLGLSLLLSPTLEHIEFTLARTWVFKSQPGNWSNWMVQRSCILGTSKEFRIPTHYTILGWW